METGRIVEQEQKDVSIGSLVEQYIPKPKRRFWQRRKRPAEYSKAADSLVLQFPVQELRAILQGVGSHPDGSHFFRQVYDEAYKDLDKKLRKKNPEEKEAIIEKTNLVMKDYLKELDARVKTSITHAGETPIPHRSFIRDIHMLLKIGASKWSKISSEEIYMNADAQATRLQLKFARIDPKIKT